MRRSVTGRGGAVACMYSGVRFRSTLEARWALWLDTLGWEWDYEPAQYPVCAGAGYVPDLYVVGYGWVEVKGAGVLTASSLSKIAAAVAGPRPLPARATPYTPPRAMLLVGDVPTVGAGHRPTHTLVLDGGEGRAEAWRCVLDGRGLPTVVGEEPTAVVDASGTVRTGALSEGLAQRLCNPAQVSGSTPAALARAYKAAGALSVGRAGRTVPRTVPGRWGGRAIGEA